MMLAGTRQEFCYRLVDLRAGLYCILFRVNRRLNYDIILD